MYETAILSASLLANLFLLVYAGMAARKLYIVSVNLGTLQEILSKFREHVELIHESEMFYGDQTLQAMIAHSKEVLEEIEAHEDLLTLASEEEPVMEEDAQR